MTDKPKYQRILLKLSGEALAGEKGFGHDKVIMNQMARSVAALQRNGLSIGVVIGGGNLFRGLAIAAEGGNRVTGDHIGMLATIMNALAFAEALRAENARVSVFSAIEIPQVAERFTQRAAKSAMNEGQIALFAGGTGNPYFSTDTAATLRAIEMGCEILLKATQVDGVYSSDPRKGPSATRYDRITHHEALEQGLGVMDMPALALARDNLLPILVFKLKNENSIANAVSGQGTNTYVYTDR